MFWAFSVDVRYQNCFLASFFVINNRPSIPISSIFQFDIFMVLFKNWSSNSLPNEIAKKMMTQKKNKNHNKKIVILFNFKIFTFARFYDRDLHKERKFGYGNSLAPRFLTLWRIYLSDKRQHCILELHYRVLRNHYLVSIIKNIVNILDR